MVEFFSSFKVATKVSETSTLAKRFAGTDVLSRFSRFSQGIKTHLVHLSLGLTTQKENPSCEIRSSEFFHRISPRGPHVNPIKFTPHRTHVSARDRPPVVGRPFVLRSKLFLTLCRPASRCFRNLQSKFLLSSARLSSILLLSLDSLINHPITTRSAILDARTKITINDVVSMRILAIYRWNNNNNTVLETMKLFARGNFSV